jgi:integrase
MREEYSTKYVINLYGLFNVMFEVARQHDLIEVIPLRRKIHRPQHQAKKKPALSAGQIRQIIEAVETGYKPLFLTVAITGLRLGEILALRWRDVDIDRGKLSVRHNLWRQKLVSPKTEASIRELHLPRVLADVLRAHKQQSRWSADEDFIFARLDGMPYDPDSLRRSVLYPALDACKIERSNREHGFHIFRHTAGSIVHAQSRDLKLTQELLGHTRISTTSDIYVHVDEKVAEEATEILAREITGELGSERVQ